MVEQRAFNSEAVSSNLTGPIFLVLRTSALPWDFIPALCAWDFIPALCACYSVAVLRTYHYVVVLTPSATRHYVVVLAPCYSVAALRACDFVTALRACHCMPDLWTPRRQAPNFAYGKI